MSNISLIFDKIKKQTFKNLKIVIFNNGKKDLSFKYCEMVKRKNLTLDIELVDSNINRIEIANYLLDKNYANILWLNGLFDQLNNINYLSDVADSISYENDTCSKFINGKQIKSKFFECNAFYENASTLLSLIENDDKLNSQDILVSVVIASYNYEKLIGQAIESVLAQTYKNIEVIVVDDGSTDRSVDVVKRYLKNNRNMKLVMHQDKKNHGLNESLKLAIVKSKGEYIAFCEADDILHPDNIAKKMRLVKYYENMPLIIANDIQTFGEVQQAAGLQTVVDQRMAILKNECNAIDDDIMLYNNLIATFSSVMLKRSALLRCSFQPSFACCTDWFLYAQILKMDNHIYVVHEKLTNWRAHQSFTSNVMTSIKNKDAVKTRQAQDFIDNLSFAYNSNKKPFFSVIIASYNYEKYIIQTLNSIINQTFTNFEIIIVDDNSTDNSMKIINEYAAKYNFIHVFEHNDQQNHGLPDTIALALHHTNGEYIAFCESDDYWHKDYLSEKMKMIIKHNFKPNIIINDFMPFGFNTDQMLELQKNRNHRMPNEINVVDPKIFNNENLICTFSICMVKKEMFNDVNFNTPFKPNLDWWLWNQMIKKDNSIYFIHKKLTYWRSHNDSQMERNRNVVKQNPTILKTFLSSLKNYKEFK